MDLFSRLPEEGLRLSHGLLQPGFMETLETDFPGQIVDPHRPFSVSQIEYQQMPATPGTDSEAVDRFWAGRSDRHRETA